MSTVDRGPPREQSANDAICVHVSNDAHAYGVRGIRVLAYIWGRCSMRMRVRRVRVLLRGGASFPGPVPCACSRVIITRGFIKGEGIESSWPLICSFSPFMHTSHLHCFYTPLVVCIEQIWLYRVYWCC